MKIRNWKLKIRNSAGFTLIEVLAAMSIMVMGTIGVFGLIGRTVAFNSSVNSQLVASYLSQEGLEIVRNMRDANFLKIHKGEGGQWNDGLTACAAGCEADYNDSVLQQFQGISLHIGASKMYTYDDTDKAPLPPCDSYGDVNGDNLVLQEDAGLVAGFLLGTVQLTDEQKRRADVRAPVGTISLNDTFSIIRYALSLQSNFPDVCPSGLKTYATTSFQRKITIDPTVADLLQVSVDVSWQDKGNTRTVRGATELYNWLTPTP